MPGKILVVDFRTPTPDQDSGSASTFSYLQILSRSGYDITFAPSNLLRVDPYTADIEKLGIRTLSKPEWNSMAEVIESFAPQSDILLFYRVGVASSIFDLAREKAPDAKIIFHAVDLHFLRSGRQAEVTGKVAEQAEAIAALREAELNLMKRADAAIVVSTMEYNLIRELAPEANVHRIPILREPPSPRPNPLSRPVPKIFQAISKWFDRRPSAKAGRRDILFVGGFGHEPNIDAVEWFVREIWPKVLSRGFRHNFIVVGSKAPAKIKALASRRIKVRGYVEELAPVFDRCRLSVAPLRYGGGVKGKIVTSLSLGLPVVATSIASEGMDLRHGENILIADTPDAMADEIIRIYSDDELWRSISSKGYAVFDATFSHSSGAPQILALIESLSGQKTDRSGAHQKTIPLEGRTDHPASARSAGLLRTSSA